ncbi:MAG: DUF4190 domain-containing protein [Nanoarchaeota archaeon]|nr:DUF4190 domain-containing protein [Nanoarchaeota archaeon]
MAEKGVSYILGIVSLVLAFFVPLAGVTLGIVGLVQNKKEKGDFAKKAKKLNVLGIIVGALLYITSILLLIFSQGLSNLI